MTAEPAALASVLDAAFFGISKAIATLTPKLAPREIGKIITVSTGIAKVSGLPGAGFEELLKFPGGVYGIAFNVDADEIGCFLGGEPTAFFSRGRCARFHGRAD